MASNTNNQSGGKKPPAKMLQHKKRTHEEDRQSYLNITSPQNLVVIEARKQKVLILCSRNSARSQMAEVLLRDLTGDRFEVISEGTEPTSAINPYAIEAMNEIGIDMSAQSPKDLPLYLGQLFIHYLIIACSKTNDSCSRVLPRLASRNNRPYWPVDDPVEATGSHEENLAAFSKT